MAKEEHWRWVERGMAAAIREGSVPIPAMLLRLYPIMKLSDMEAMLLIHLIAFKEKEGKDFPTIEELQGRMSSRPDAVVKALQRLVNDQYLQIDEETDPDTGVHGERYNLTPLYRRIAAAWVETAKQEAALAEASRDASGKISPTAESMGVQAVPPTPASGFKLGILAGAGEKSSNIFTIFENEFARPLTPMECETIAQWLDKDSYPEPLILLALKEAVFAGVVHFRYIDRILLEWQRNRVQTPEQAREYAQKFRGAK